MSADPLFYEIFKEIPELFFELIGESGKDTSIYKFSAPEIKQRSFRFDGLLFTPENSPKNQFTLLKLIPIRMIIFTTNFLQKSFFI
ncbi:MAG: DUF2887 domain-containing protein [Calothrix sp. MO_167.B12]|nr:DUF2887 domain-containing protein [Calothrix sp. MO_167.B12]